MPTPSREARRSGSFAGNQRGGAPVSQCVTPSSPFPIPKPIQRPIKIRKWNADKRWSYPPHLTGAAPPPAGDGSPVGVPPRLSPKRLVIPKAQLQARLPGTRSDAGSDQRSCVSKNPLAGVTRLRLSQSREAPPAPVIVPGDMMPKLPEGEVQVRPRVPHSPRPPACLRKGVLTERDDSFECNRMEDICQETPSPQQGQYFRHFPDAVLEFVNIPGSAAAPACCAAPGKCR
jgi:hypothetical protein